MGKEENRLSYNEVRARMALPYEIKIRMSENRLRGGWGGCVLFRWIR